MSRPHRPWRVSNRSFICWQCRTRSRASTYRQMYPGERITCVCGATLCSPFGVATVVPAKVRKGRWKKLLKQVTLARMREHNYWAGPSTPRGIEAARRNFFKTLPPK
jgi:hypothetical protein